MRILIALILVVLIPTLLLLPEKAVEPKGTPLVQGKPLRQKSPAQVAEDMAKNDVLDSKNPMASLQALAANTEALFQPVSEIPTPVATVSDGSVQFLSFDVLGGYPYDIDTSDASMSLAAEIYKAKLDSQIPSQILTYHNQFVEVEGYMIPIDFHDGKVLSFVLVSSPMACCFGMIPRINEWIHIMVEKPGVSSLLVDMPLRIRGTLDIGADIQDQAVMSLYRMQAKSVTPSGAKH
ncbi:MAG: DUF3299 domain-containing protein [Candidatus Cloacimonetes bacterium]|nr:DUF3299 domain-containing protein [Candidatus Cloacimonadota bacterium]